VNDWVNDWVGMLLLHKIGMCDPSLVARAAMQWCGGGLRMMFNNRECATASGAVWRCRLHMANALTNDKQLCRALDNLPKHALLVLLERQRHGAPNLHGDVISKRQDKGW
jgi:hypothetical protein